MENLGINQTAKGHIRWQISQHTTIETIKNKYSLKQYFKKNEGFEWSTPHMF